MPDVERVRSVGSNSVAVVAAEADEVVCPLLAILRIVRGVTEVFAFGAQEALLRAEIAHNAAPCGVVAAAELVEPALPQVPFPVALELNPGATAADRDTVVTIRTVIRRGESDMTPDRSGPVGRRHETITLFA